MMDINKQHAFKAAPTDRHRSYTEVTDYLDRYWSTEYKLKSLDRVKKLDQALGSVSQKINAIFVAGTNGKSTTVHLTSKLLKEEGLKVGAFYSPHILTYNERFSINNEIISNKLFTEIANEVINTAESLSLLPHTYELLTLIALKYFEQQNVDVALLEVNEGGTYNPVNICNAKVVAVTRVTPTNVLTSDEQLFESITDIMGIVKENSWIVSGDQSKAHLQKMQELTQAQKGHWAMPIRKLAALTYPFEQLHGRCASLSERLSQMFVENFLNKNVTITSDSLLTKQRGQRGRPTLEAKRHSELHPRKTLEQFWKEELSELPARFQLLEKEKPSILLDTACNIDAFKNLLLGIRLLHYQKPLKGLSLIVAASENTIHNEEFLKLIRYFFKKTAGQIFICPLDSHLAGTGEDISWDAEKVANDIKSMKLKARSCKNFEEAFDLAKKSVDERNGLIVITGSRSIINSYWSHKGIKKF